MFSFFKSKSKPAAEPDPAAPVPEALQPVTPPPAIEAEAVTTPEPVTETAAAVPRLGWAQRLKQGLAKTRGRLGGQLSSLLGVGRKIDAELFEELETLLITADIGMDATQALLDT